jgi:protein-S-isoprenylcysteine O-methyltransferase Ste14
MGTIAPLPKGSGMDIDPKQAPAETGTSAFTTPAGRVLSVGYAAAVYIAFVAVLGYSVAFLANVVVPRTVDQGPRTGTLTALVIDSLLLGLFAVQHTVMARPAFKVRWTAVLPAHLERSTFVLGATALLALTYAQWRPLPMVVWDVEPQPARVAIWVLYGAGWALVVAMTFAIDHFDMFGLRQVAHHLRGAPSHSPGFRCPLPYRLVRHPMMTGFFLAFLAAPTMTVGHLLFAGLGCGYILLGVRLEERDLRRTLPEYPGYAAATPRFLPYPRRA